jgi:hypothetical protein
MDLWLRTPTVVHRCVSSTTIDLGRGVLAGSRSSLGLAPASRLLESGRR